MGNGVAKMVNKVIKVVVIFNFLTMGVMAKNMSGRLRVRTIKKKTRSTYSVQFKEKAAIYSSDKKHFKCLADSAKDYKKVLVRWDMKTLKINGCKK